MRQNFIKAADKAANTVIRLLGPIFIVLAVVLIGLACLVYFTVVFPYFYKWEEDHILTKIFYCFGLVFSIYMVICIFFHYYMAIITKPGGVSNAGIREMVRNLMLNMQFSLYTTVCFIYLSLYV